jgi:putative membrane protein
VNTGESVLDSLKDSTSINWVFTDSTQAVEGVNSGEYYAAIVLEADFSQNMYQGFMEGLIQPTIYYYENEKKNAVATKITDTAVSKVKTSIDEMYVSIIVSTLFEDVEDSGQLQGGTLVTKLTKRMETLNKQIEAYSQTLQSLMEADTKLDAALDDAKEDLDTVQGLAKDSSATLSDTSIGEFHSNVQEKSASAVSSLTESIRLAQSALEEESEELRTELLSDTIDEVTKAKQHFFDILSAMENLRLHSTTVQSQIQQVSRQLQTKIEQLDRAVSLLEAAKQSAKEQVTETINDALERLEEVDTAYEEAIVPLIDNIVLAANTVIQDSSSALGNIAEDMDLISQITTGVQSSVSTANDSLQSLLDELTKASQTLEDAKTKITGLTESELVEKVQQFLQGDPSGYGAFFAEPVGIETTTVYPVENYGSGVAPFYTTLALWVGGIFLISLMKVKAGTKGLDAPKPHELFFGRYVLFFLLGQLQTLILVFGNLYLLKIQCLYPFRFWLACALTSFTFTLLIYATALSFGDVGKALLVVVMVVQIAGSSGTYPIEILPQFYQKVYIFFPFPYAINAMRETICGMYGNDYVIYLVELLLFAAAALLLGLVIRLPFMQISHFVEKRMEDTGMM